MGFGLIIKETVTSIKKKEFNLKTVFLIQFLLIFLCVLVFADLQLYKLNPLFIMMLIFAAEAIIWLYNKRKFIGYSIIAVLIVIFIIFEIYYFKNVNIKVGVGFNTDFIPLIQYLDEKYPDKEIYLETDAIQQYIYLLVEKQMSPYDFMENMEMVQFITGETEVTRVGKYHFIFYEIDKEMVYVIEENCTFRVSRIKELEEKLNEEGFEAEKYNNFYIYTYQD